MIVYPSGAIQKVGFDKILELLLEESQTTSATEHFRRSPISSNFQEVKVLQEQTAEYESLLNSSHKQSNFDFYEIRDHLLMLEKENAILEEEAFHAIRNNLRYFNSLFELFERLQEEYPTLFQVIRQFESEPKLEAIIDNYIDNKAEIKESISPELSRIRSEIRREEGSLNQAFNKVLKKAQQEGWLSDEGESVRNGRRVLAVNATHKRQLGGMVYDESATGKTVFIEPRELLDINNRIFELNQEERRERFRILRELGNKLKPYIAAIQSMDEGIVQIDIIRARARVSSKLEGQKIKISQGAAIRLIKAKNPILALHFGSYEKVVAQDISLEEPQKMLMISGPNAGGKSVTLKTTGLLQLMFQSGLLIPAEENSQLGIYEKLFVDLGDDQNIENDLSTYSSHLTYLNYFCRNANENTLVLTDEMGSGTDPSLGGALAEAILLNLLEKKVTAVITTHYGNLKKLALEHPNFISAAMEFDRSSLQPTYRLVSGKPGSSYSFEIARTIGLPDEVIKKAAELAGYDSVEMDETLAELQSKEQDLTKKLEEAERLRQQHERLKTAFDKMKQNLESNQRKQLIQSKKRAEEYVRILSGQFENLVREWKEESKNKDKRRKEVKDTLNREREKLNEEIERLEVQQEKNEQSNTDFKRLEKKLEVGDRVRIKGGNQMAELIELKGKSAVVSLGNMTITVEQKKLEVVEQSKESRKKGGIGNSYLQKATSFNTRLDIRGMRLEEALQKLNSWLDEAYMLGHSELQVIHGKGDGILRKAVHQLKHDNPYIESIKYDHADRGGEGASFISFRK